MNHETITLSPDRRWWRLYRHEFRDQRYWPSDNEIAALSAAGFSDFSYHNDVCPSFGRELAGDFWVQLFIDCADPHDREMPSTPRFSVLVYGGERGDYSLYEGDDFEVALLAAQIAEIYDSRSDVDYWYMDTLERIDNPNGHFVYCTVQAIFEAADCVNPDNLRELLTGTLTCDLDDYGRVVDHVINWE